MTEITNTVNTVSTDEIEFTNLCICDELLCEEDTDDDGFAVTVINATFECWFDVEKKFGVKFESDDEWINLYADYEPYSGKLKMYYIIDGRDMMDYVEYEPTEDEKNIVITLIGEYTARRYNQTPLEFVEDL